MSIYQTTDLHFVLYIYFMSNDISLIRLKLIIVIMLTLAIQYRIHQSRKTLL